MHHNAQIGDVDYLEEGKEEYKKGNFEEAMKCFDCVLRFENVEPEDRKEAYLYRALLKSKLNQYEEAEKDFEAMKEQGKSEVDVDAGFQRIFVKISAGKIVEAAQAFQKAYVEADRDNIRDIIFYLDRIWFYQTPQDINRIRVILDNFEDNKYIRTLCGGIRFLTRKYDASILTFLQGPGLSAFEYYLRANAQYQLQMYEKAIRDYTQAICLNSDYAVAYKYRGDAKCQLGLYEEAIQDYDQAILRYKNFIRTYVDRANVKYKLKMYDQAIKDCEEAISRKPDCLEAYYIKAMSEIKLDKIQDAIESYNKLVALDPYCEVASEEINFLAEKLRDYINSREADTLESDESQDGGPEEDILKSDESQDGDPEEDVLRSDESQEDELEQYEQAIKQYDEEITKQQYGGEVISLCIGVADLYRRRGDIKYQLKRYEEAIEDYNMAITPNSSYPELYKRRGDAKYQLGLYAEAIKDYDVTINVSKDDEDAYKKRGDAKYQLGLYAEAIKDYDKGFSILRKKGDTRQEEFFVKRGYAKYKLKRYKEAIDDFNNAMKKKFLKKEFLLDALYGKAMANKELGKYKAALKNCEEMLKVKAKMKLPKSFLVEKGNIEFKLKLYQEAMDDYYRAIEEDNSNVYAYLGRGVVRACLKLYLEALEDFNRVLEFKDDCEIAYYNRGCIMTHFGNFSDAESDFYKAIELGYDFKDNDVFKDNEVLNLLDYASGRNHTKFMRVLLNAQVPQGIINEALIMAIINNAVDATQLLVDEGADVEYRDQNGLTPLMEAASNECEGAIEVLLSQYAKLEAKDKHGDTALIFAAKKDDKKSFILLLENGADIATIGQTGMNALHWAVSSNSLNVVRALFEDFILKIIQNTPVEDRDKKKERIILDLIKLFDQRDKEGNTVLHIAILKANKEMCKLLLGKGADKNAFGKNGSTPLHMAISSNNEEICKVLLENGAGINEKDKKGETPLEYLNKRNVSENIKQMIYSVRDLIKEAVGAVGSANVLVLASLMGRLKPFINERVSKEYGGTLLHLAVANGNEEVCKLLVQNGANPHQPNLDNLTPLDIAKEERIINILVNPNTTHQNVMEYISSIEKNEKVKEYHSYIKKELIEEIHTCMSITSNRAAPRQSYIGSAIGTAISFLPVVGSMVSGVPSWGEKMLKELRTKKIAALFPSRDDVNILINYFTSKISLRYFDYIQILSQDELKVFKNKTVEFLLEVFGSKLRFNEDGSRRDEILSCFNRKIEEKFNTQRSFKKFRLLLDDLIASGLNIQIDQSQSFEELAQVTKVETIEGIDGVGNKENTNGDPKSMEFKQLEVSRSPSTTEESEHTPSPSSSDKSFKSVTPRGCIAMGNGKQKAQEGVEMLT